MASCCAVRTRGEHADREEDDGDEDEDEDDDGDVEGERRTLDDAMDITPRRYHSSTASGTGRTCRPSPPPMSPPPMSIPSAPSFLLASRDDEGDDGEEAIAFTVVAVATTEPRLYPYDGSTTTPPLPLLSFAAAHPLPLSSMLALPRLLLPQLALTRRCQRRRRRSALLPSSAMSSSSSSAAAAALRLREERTRGIGGGIIVVGRRFLEEKSYRNTRHM